MTTNVTIHDGIATFPDGTQVACTVAQLRALPKLLQFAENYEVAWGPRYDNQDSINGSDAVEWLMWGIEEVRQILQEVRL